MLGDNSHMAGPVLVKSQGMSDDALLMPATRSVNETLADSVLGMTSLVCVHVFVGCTHAVLLATQATLEVHGWHPLEYDVKAGENWLTSACLYPSTP